MKLIELQEKIVERGIRIFTVREFRQLMETSEVAAQKILERYCKIGILTRLKKGLYAVKAKPPTTFQMANRLYQPSYISFETALSYHGILPETIYAIVSATTKPTREFDIGGRMFIYHKIKKKAYVGYEPVRLDNDVIKIASPEKALADHLYMVHLGRKKLNGRLSIGRLNKKKIIKYARIYERPKFSKWVKDDFLGSNQEVCS